jgi:hypothetical protein
MPEKSKRLSAIASMLGGRLAILVILLGLLAVGLAWNGAAGVPSTPAQIPYLLSGLGLGLGLITTGAALMIVQSAREDRARLEVKLDALTDALRNSSGTAAVAGGTTPTDLSGLVVAGSASYHTPGCKLVDGREEVTYLTPEEARARFLTPCRVCSPDQEQSNVSVR